MDKKISGVLKIVFIHQDANITGSAISMLNLIKGFGSKVIVHVVLPENGPLTKALQSLGIDYSIITFVRFWSTPGPKWHSRQAVLQVKAIFPILEIQRRILSLQPDIVHINDKVCMQVGISLKGSGIPIVQHLRSSYFTTYFSLNKILSIRCIKQYADSIIAISSDETQGFEGDPRVHIIFNSVDLEQTERSIRERTKTREKLGIAKEEFVIGFAAGISRMKGAWDYMEMAGELLKQYPKHRLKFLIAGNAPKPQARKSFLQKLGLREVPYHQFSRHQERLKGNLSILGFQEKILDIISAFDILVIPTHLGALGRQPFESMAVKTPVVVTGGHSGKSRIVLHEKTGLVVPMKKVEALTDAVRRLIEDPSLRETLARQGYEYARAEFNPVVNSQKVLQLYQELTGIQIPEKTDYAGA